MRATQAEAAERAARADGPGYLGDRLARVDFALQLFVALSLAAWTLALRFLGRALLRPRSLLSGIAGLCPSEGRMLVSATLAAVLSFVPVRLLTQVVLRHGEGAARFRLVRQ